MNNNNNARRYANIPLMPTATAAQPPQPPPLQQRTTLVAAAAAAASGQDQSGGQFSSAKTRKTPLPVMPDLSESTAAAAAAAAAAASMAAGGGGDAMRESSVAASSASASASVATKTTTVPRKNQIKPEDVDQLKDLLFTKHKERADHVKRSKELDKEMKRIKTALNTFMHDSAVERIGSVADGRYYVCRYKEKEHGIKSKDIWDAWTRRRGDDEVEEVKALIKAEHDTLQYIWDAWTRRRGAAEVEEVKAELLELSKKMEVVMDSRITYAGLRKAGESNPGVVPRKRMKKQ